LPDLQLTIKKFQRSVNRDEEDKESQSAQNYVPRNHIGLLSTMQHIKTNILDAEVKDIDELPFPMPPNQTRI
jgi:hypothetical protein